MTDGVEAAVPIVERVCFGGSRGRPSYTDLLRGIKLPEEEKPYEVFLRAPVGPECYALLMFSGKPGLEDLEQLERFIGVYKQTLADRGRE